MTGLAPIPMPSRGTYADESKARVGGTAAGNTGVPGEGGVVSTSASREISKELVATYRLRLIPFIVTHSYYT